MNTHKSRTIHIVHDILNVCSNLQHSNYSRQESTQESKKTQLTVYISYIPVTLKQSQGHQTYHENVDPEQDYNHAKFERSHFN